MAALIRHSPISQTYLPFLYPSLFLVGVGSGRNAAARHLSRATTRCYFSSRSSNNNNNNNNNNSSSSRSSNGSTPDDDEPRTRLNPAPDDYSRPSFADKANLTIYAGGGGNGCISFLREAFVAEGPANGGDGGYGGNVYIQAVHGETSLHKLARRRFIRAGRGMHGQGSSKGGQRGEDVVIPVPVGTVVRELSRDDPNDTGDAPSPRRRYRRRKPRRPPQPTVTAEDGSEPEIDDPERDQWLLYPGISSSERRRIELPRLPYRERLFAQPRGPIHLDLSRATPHPILLAAGGVGGLGNPHFVSRERQKPLFATKGERAISMEIELELKLLADVGLVGLPNAGKSTLLRALSNSQARVGSWAFTTLQPNIGTVVLDHNRGRPAITSFRRGAGDTEGEAEAERRTRFTVADIPGLIEGAHLDRGLGIAFLRHVERAGVLAFVVDLSAGDAVTALNALWHEVGLYAQMREDEERERERQQQASGDDSSSSSSNQDVWSGTALGMGMGGAGDVVRMMMMGEDPLPPANPTGLHIAAKPWFVVATKADLPGTEDNYARLMAYLAGITRGDVPHPSGVVGAAWTHDCTAIPVSAINGQGVDRVVHWTVGLLDG